MSINPKQQIDLPGADTVQDIPAYTSLEATLETIEIIKRLQPGEKQTLIINAKDGTITETFLKETQIKPEEMWLLSCSLSNLNSLFGEKAGINQHSEWGTSHGNRITLEVQIPK